MSNLSEIVGFLKAKGLSNIAIAAIVGNLREESGLNSGASNSGEGAIGLAQWEGGRRTALQHYAAQHGGSEGDLNIQLGYLWHELTTSYSHVLHQIQNASSVAEAARIWDVGSGGQGSGTGFENSAGTTTNDRIQFATQFYNTGKIDSIPASAGVHTDSAGSSLLTGGGAQQEQMTKADFQNVDNLGKLLSSVPELSKLVDKAVSGNWTSDKFQNAVEDSTWWKQHSQTARSAIIQKANDPASWTQTLQNTQNSITSLSHQLGMALTPDEIVAIANHALLTGNDSNQQWITQQISKREDYSKLGSVNGLQGGMAATSQQLQSLAAAYGMNWSPAQIAQNAQSILSGATTLDTYQQRLKGWAKSAFPGLAQEIDGGATVKDLADPYIQSMSQLLELDPGTLTTYTPAIRKAMQGVMDPKTKMRTPINLSDFEDQVRQDPRWQFTQNAKDTMSTALLKVGADFGFGPEG